MPEHRILIVEQDEGLVLHLQILLQKSGYAALGPVSRGDDALRQACMLRPDVALIDTHLADGATGAFAGQQMTALCDVPVVYLLDAGETPPGGPGSGPFAALTKPVQQRDLQIALELARYKHDMERRLRESEARYRRLFDTMTSAFVLLSVHTDERGCPCDYRVVDFNQAYLKLFNVQPEDVAGRRLVDLLSEEDLRPYLHLYHETLVSGAAVQLDYYYAPQNRYFEIHAYSPDSGQMALILNDVSERRIAQQAVAESELRFRQMAETVNEVFWLSSRQDNKMLYVSPAFQRIWGSPLEEAYNGPSAFLNSVHPDDAPRVHEAQQALSQRGEVFNAEYRIVRPDGSHRWVWARTFPVREPDGEVVRYSGIAEDITERKIAEQALMQSYRRTEQALRRMTVLRNIDTAITTHTDLSTMVGVVLDHINQLDEVDAAVLFYPNIPACRQRGLCPAGSTGLPGGDLPAALACNLSIEAERVYLSGKVSASEHLRRPGDLAILPHLREAIAQQMGFEGHIFLPLLTKGQVKGVLLLLRRADRQDGDMLHFFQSLALQAAIAIDNVELLQNLNETNSELRHAYDETIKGWAQALELRSADTRGHCDRVVQLSEVLARALGMTGEDLVHFRRGVMLHDIGKLGIPDSILLKEGSLTPDEWTAIHMHPVYGYEMLSGIDYLRPAVNVPYCHHERWDGSGYPRGLAGLEIPREARIFAVVDAWDALINQRPYHPPWPREEAIEYLRAQAGKQFDPEVVEAFLKII